MIKKLNTKETMALAADLQKKGAIVGDIYVKYAAICLDVKPEEFLELDFEDTEEAIQHVTDRLSVFSK